MFLKSTITVTGPASEPVSLADAKTFLRVDTSSQDALISAMVTAAREAVEAFTGRSLVSQQFRLVMPDWQSGYKTEDRSGELTPIGLDTLGSNRLLTWYPTARRTDWNVIPLDRSPLISVDSVKYYDPSGAQVTLDPSNYYVITHCEPGALALKSTSSWPSLFDRPDCVQITFTAGMPDAGSVSQTLRLAIMLLVKRYYDQRDAFVIGSGSAIEVPLGVKHMLESKRVGSWVT